MKNEILRLWAKLCVKVRGASIIESSIDKTSKIEAGCNIVKVKMDRYSFCGYDCEIVNTEIGSFCSIANGVHIGGAMHPIEWASTSPVFYAGRDSVKKKFSEHLRPTGQKTVIGNDVWIGGGAKIKQGVKISNGAVIGMGAIVTKDVAPYAIVGGNPANLIRMRFDNSTIECLEESEWWNASDSILAECAHLVMNPKAFAVAVKKLRSE